MELVVRFSESCRFKPRPMTDSFCRVHFSMMFYQQETSNHEMLKQIGISTNEIY